MKTVSVSRYEDRCCQSICRPFLSVDIKTVSVSLEGWWSY